MVEYAKKKGEPEPVIPKPYIPADAVAPCAKPGHNAGNPLIDRVNEEIKRDTFSKKFRKFYDNFIKRKK